MRRVYLSDDEAKLLGLRLNKTQKGKSKARYKIDEQALDKINRIRSIGVIDLLNSQGVDPETAPYLWVKSKEGSTHVKNPFFVSRSEKAYLDMRDQIISDLSTYSPTFKKIKRRPSKESHLMVLDPADIHIGKLCTVMETGSRYDSEIAYNRCIEGVKSLIDKTKGFKIDKILFVGGNDVLHTDNKNKSTTSGTLQDTDGMWYENFLKAKDLYVEIIETLLGLADVHYVHNMSNHDELSGFFLSDVIKTYFRKCKNMSFDCSPKDRKYFAYGNSLIQTTHGHGAKAPDLGALMSVEAKDLWSKSEFRYSYSHHIHHKTSKDYINITHETLRSPSSADSWHAKKGYLNQPAVECFLHSKTKGQVARFTHYF